MGTYTTNYQLYMPSIGEQGWGELVNGDFTTIDTTMKGLDTRLTTCESTDVAYNTRLETLEAGEFETINCAGTITADIVTAGKLCGNRVGVTTTTKPTLWHSSVDNCNFTTIIYNYNQTSASGSFTMTNNNLQWWDVIENVNCTYTLVYSSQGNNAVSDRWQFTFTDFITGETVLTDTYTVNGGNPITRTVEAPMLCSISVYATKIGGIADAYLNISRPAVYIKPKGT